MGKQSNKPTQVSQEQFNKDLDKSLEILHNDGASDQELIDYTNDYKSRFIVEKKNPNGTATTQKKSGESVQTNGSLDSQKMKTFEGFNEKELKQLKGESPKQKELTPEAKSVIENPNNKVGKVKLKEDRSFGGEVMSKLAVGSSQLGADVSAVPELVYEIFSAPQNYISKKFNIPSLATSPEKFKENIGVDNVIKDYYQNEVAKLRQESELVDKKYQYGITDSFIKGDYANGFRQLTDSFAESAPSTASIMVGGAYAKAPQLLTASTMMFGAGKNEQLKQENPEMNSNVRLANSLATGLAEGAFETLGSGSIGSTAKALVQREGKEKAFSIMKDGLEKFYKEALKKNPLTASVTGEGIGEWATQVTQNSIDVATGAKPKDYNVFTGGADAFIGGAFMGSVFGAGLHGLDKMVTNQDQNLVKQNLKKTFALQEQLANPEISETVKSEIQKNIDTLIKENQKIVSSAVDHVDSLDEKVKSKLAESVDKMSEIKAKTDEIKSDSNTSDATKQILLSKLKEEYESANKDKISIIEGNTSVVDVLPLKEQDKLKRDALKELTSELNPEGKENVTITNEQITERANKLYKANQEQIKSESNEQAKPQEVVEQKSETQPQAKEQEKVAEVDNLALSLDDTQEQTNAKIEKSNKVEQLRTDEQIELKEALPNAELNNEGKIDAEKLSEEDKVIFDKVYDKYDKLITPLLENETASPNNIESNADIRPSVEQLGEVANQQQTASEIASKESVQSANDFRPIKGQTEVEHALSQIDKGVLNWDGNINSPRIDLGMSWADIRKGEADLKRGKIDSVPAKRLLDAFENAKKEGGYRYKMGTGGKNMRSGEFVTFEDMQRAVNENEFTDLEIEEINTNEEQLVQEYYNSFDKLTEEEQNEILENYEGKTNEQTKVGEDTEIGNSKNDVSNEEKSRTFERKPGELSVLNRLKKGGNSDKITEAIEKIGTKYDVRNQDQLARSVSQFVDEVGILEAYNSIVEGKIKNDDTIILIYDEIVQRMPEEIEKTLDGISNQNEKYQEEQALYEEYAKIQREYAEKAMSMGQGISILNYIYNRNSAVKYDLSRQIQQYKANNNGEIPDNVLEAFKEADEKLKVINEKIKEAEEKLKKAEEEQAIKNIQEDIEKRKQSKPSRKPHLSEEEKIRKNELRKKFFGTLNDVTRFAVILADPEFREYLKLTLKEASGEFREFAEETLKTLGKGARKYLPELYKEAGGKGEVDTKFLNTIKISKDGKISIPEQMIRDYVEEGYTEIDDLAKVLLDTIKDEYPDVDIRDIRNAITKYGKTISPSKDEVSAQIRKMRRIGKLISGLEDAYNGKRPKRSGLQRDELTQQEREMKRELRDLLRDLPMDDTDTNKKWKTALDAVKSRLKNSIEDLEKQIANKEKSKPERNPIEYDEEAKSLKRTRDELRTILEDLVGKPELTEEQKIERTEKYLVKSIDALREQIDSNNIAFKSKGNPVTSARIENLKEEQSALRKQLAELRRESGLVEAKRLETAKKSVKNRISDLERRIKEGDYSKKEIRPLVPDTELSQLQAEKIRVQEVFDSEKYKQELKNRTKFQKGLDALLEIWNVPRILKATGEVSTVFVQGGILTVSRKSNPIVFLKEMKRLFTSIGSDKKTREFESLIKAHPLYPIAEKAKLALTNPDYKSSVKEEMYTGDYMNLIWDAPIFMTERAFNRADLTNKEVTPIGDKFLNKVKQLLGKEIKEVEKVKAKEQWKNLNPLVALERGGTMYMNKLRFEEFVRGCEMLELEGKNPIDNIDDYKLLANAINTMTGRANIGTLATNSKVLAGLFFSFRNWVSVTNQMNPIYYGYLHFADSKINSSTWYKETSVANKLATMNMMRFITITGTTIMLMKALAGKDDEDKDVIEVETDPRSSDFMKMKIGNIRFDPWHGQSTQVVFMTRMLTDQKKSTSDGEIKKLGEGYGGVKSRGDLSIQYVSNKFAPSMAMMWKYMNTHEGYDKLTGEKIRLTPYGEVYDSSDESLNLSPMYWASLKEIQNEDPNAWAQFLTVASFFGVNSTVYKDSNSFERKQAELAKEFSMGKTERIAKKKEQLIKEYEGQIKKFEEFKKAKKEGKKEYYKSATEKWETDKITEKEADNYIKRYEQAIKEVENMK